LLACCLLARLLFNYFLLLYSAGRDGEGQPESNLSIAQNCSEPQMSFSTLSVKTWFRSPKTVAKRKFHLLSVNLLAKNVVSKTVAKRKFHILAVNPLAKNVVSIAQNCSKTLHFCPRRCSETYILKFWMARRCSETHILILPDEPS